MESKPFTDQSFPKVELHIHLCGAIRHSTLWDLSQKRDIQIGATSLEELERQMLGWETGDLPTFLHQFTKFMPAVVGSIEAARRISYELCEDLTKQGVVYAEIRLPPHLLANAPGIDRVHRGPEGTITPRDIVRAVNEGIRQGEKDFGIKAKTILCMMRHKPEWSAELVELCKEFHNDTVVGIDMAANEMLELHEGHIQAFQAAARAGIHRTCHAGESGPAGNVRQAIEVLRAERVGHGYHSADDDDVLKLVKDESIHLEVCPTSSLRTGTFKDFESHAAKRFLAEGINMSLNTDDPSLFGNTMTGEFGIARKHFGMDDKALALMTLNAAQASFLPEEEKTMLVNKLRSALERIL